MPLHPTPYRKPPGRSVVDPYDFGVDPDALMDEELWAIVVDKLSRLDVEAFHALRLVAAAPTSARVRILAEIDQARAQLTSRRPIQRAG